MEEGQGQRYVCVAGIVQENSRVLHEQMTEKQMV